MKWTKSIPVLGFICFFCFATFNGLAQFVETPAVVKQAFDKKFPDAKEVEWQHNIGKPEVKFKQADRDCWARFTSKGEWEVTETKLKDEDIPGEVKDGWKKSKYADWPVKAISRYQRINSVIYKIVVSKGALNTKSLYFNEKGQLQKENITI